jgi:hypothetical protein
VVYPDRVWTLGIVAVAAVAVIGLVALLWNAHKEPVPKDVEKVLERTNVNRD